MVLEHRRADPRFGWNLPRYLVSLGWFLRRARALPTDIFHIHDLFLWPLAAHLPGRVVLDVHENHAAFGGLVSGFAGWAHRRYDRYVSAYVTTAPANVAATSNPVVVIPNWQRREDFDGALSERRRIVYFGSLSPETRDVEGMLRVVAMALEACPQVTAEFGGPVDCARPAATLAALAEWECRYPDRFRYHGVMARDDVIRRSRDAAAGLMLVSADSPNVEAGSWNKIYEYLSAGSVLFASRGFDCAAEVEAAQAGILYSAGTSSETIGRDLVALLHDPPRLARMRAASRQLGARYDWETVAGKYLDLYSRIVDATPVSSSDRR